MNHDTDADQGEAPDAVDRLLGRRTRVRPLPGPRSGPPRLALGAPAPTVRAEDADRVPAAEVSMSPRRVYVTTEISGASMDTIEVAATVSRLTVRAPREGGPAYHVEVELPVRVEPKSAKVTYRNGVLDVTLSRTGTKGGRDGDE